MKAIVYQVTSLHVHTSVSHPSEVPPRGPSRMLTVTLDPVDEKSPRDFGSIAPTFPGADDRGAAFTPGARFELRAI